MPRIFISYRRKDSATFTGRIHDSLVVAFGEKNVFRDVYDIPAGRDFRKVLEEAVNKCDTFLAIIGPSWASITDANGNRRLHDPDDFVRIEVESALKKPDTRVVPVLVDNASMPQPDDLPESLRDLCYRNAVVVRTDPDFPTDMGRLVRQLQPFIFYPILRKWWPAFIALVALAVAVLFWPAQDGQNNAPPATNPVSVVSPASPAVAGNGEEEATPALSGLQATPIAVGQGFGYRADAWQLYFTAPEQRASGIFPDVIVPVGYKIDAGDTYTVKYSFSLYEESNQDSQIKARLRTDDQITVLEQNPGHTWTKIRSQNGMDGWSLSEDLVIGLALSIEALPTQKPSGPDMFGIDVRLADAISRAKRTIDIAVYEFDNQEITQAVLQAHQRGVQVRVVTDDETFSSPEDTTLDDLEAAGIPIITDNRSGLMHDKFIILDGTTVWSGSWNFTESATYNNNENSLVFASSTIAAIYQAEFDEMFVGGEFGPKSPVSTLNEVTLLDVPIEIYFAPEDEITSRLLTLIREAQQSIRVMAFTFTNDDLGTAIAEQAGQGLKVDGIFENRTSGTQVSELNRLVCAGAAINLDGNSYSLHHKVIIIDDEIVITGSMNFSSNALEVNDENVIIVHDPRLAAAYNGEFERLWSVSTSPIDVTCNN